MDKDEEVVHGFFVVHVIADTADQAPPTLRISGHDALTAGSVDGAVAQWDRGDAFRCTDEQHTLQEGVGEAV